jgi:hypothetical protein
MFYHLQEIEVWRGTPIKALAAEAAANPGKI